MAWVAAEIPYKMKSSTLRWSFGVIQSSGTNAPSFSLFRGTSQAYLVARLLASNLLIVVAPDCPSSNDFQVCSTPQPKGVTIPNPVTTTLLIFLPFLF